MHVRLLELDIWWLGPRGGGWCLVSRICVWFNFFGLHHVVMMMVGYFWCTASLAMPGGQGQLSLCVIRACKARNRFSVVPLKLPPTICFQIKRNINFRQCWIGAESCCKLIFFYWVLLFIRFNMKKGFDWWFDNSLNVISCSSAKTSDKTVRVNNI